MSNQPGRIKLTVPIELPRPRVPSIMATDAFREAHWTVVAEHPRGVDQNCRYGKCGFVMSATVLSGEYDFIVCGGRRVRSGRGRLDLPNGQTCACLYSKRAATNASPRSTTPKSGCAISAVSVTGASKPNRILVSMVAGHRYRWVRFLGEDRASTAWYGHAATRTISIMG